MKDIYSAESSEYREKTGTWHAEDSRWKASQIARIIANNKLNFKTVVEVGCGVGEILYSLDGLIGDDNIIYDGFDIAQDAIKVAVSKSKKNVRFFCQDFLATGNKYDLLLMIDVFEHVPDYIGFIEKCNQKADYKIFHIPLDIHLSAILRNRLVGTRNSVGHLHYFTKETALATLKDTGLNVVDHFYTYKDDPRGKIASKLASLPRKLLYPILPALTVKILGGYSLIVLAR